MRQARKNRLVYIILAECRFVSFEAKAPQPISEVHDRRAPKRLTRIIVLVGDVVGGRRNVSESASYLDLCSKADVSDGPNCDVAASPPHFRSSPQSRLSLRAIDTSVKGSNAAETVMPDGAVCPLLIR